MNKNNTALIIIDIQEKFIPHINAIDEVIKNTCKLINASNILNIPVIATEQYPKGLGNIDSRLSELLKEKPYAKTCFSCFGSEEFKIKLKELNVKNLVLCGIESHVCVTQTFIDALDKGYNVYLVANAISSRHDFDHVIALERAKQEGVKLVTAEMIIFDFLRDANHEKFKEISKIVR